MLDISDFLVVLGLQMCIFAYICKNFMTTKERIRQYADSCRTSRSVVEKEMGMSKGTLGNDSKLNADAIVKLLECNPDLSAEWLMRGEGNMFRGNTPSNVNNFDMSTIKDNGIKIGDNNNNVSVGNSKDETIQKILEMQQQLLNYLTTDKV